MTKIADIRYIVSSTTTNQNGFLSLSEWLLATSVDEPLSGFWVAQTAFRAVVQIGLSKVEQIRVKSSKVESVKSSKEE